MSITKRALTAICLITVGLYSCSRQTTIPTQLTYTPAPIFQIPDSLFNEARIDFAFYEVKPAQFYEPKLEIRDSFTTREKTQIDANDENLFARHPEIVLDLANIADGSFVFPLSGAKVISPYGRRHSRMHYGMDLKVDRRNTAVAAFDGVVRMAGWVRGYGNVVVVRHYNGLETVYAHNSKNLVRSGDRVSAGTPIVISGQTGRATTDHVHFEIRIDGKTIDPALVINFDNQALHHQCLVFSADEKGKIKVEVV